MEFDIQFLEIIDNEKDESKVQRFFEKFPRFLVGTRYLVKTVLISKLPLGSEFKTDFAYVTQDSSGTYLELVELENPSLQIFNDSDDSFTVGYNKALQQVLDWKHWCNKNQTYIADIMSPIFDGNIPSNFKFRFHLILGRRKELNNKKRQDRWSAKQELKAEDFNIYSYDRLHNLIKMNQDLNERYPLLKCVSYKNKDFFEKEILALDE
jgi:hypothetical protein